MTSIDANASPNRPSEDDHAETQASSPAPLKSLLFGYLTYVVVTWLLLCIPFCQSDSSQASALDHLFAAVSAVSTTGLVTTSTPDTYSGWGEAVLVLAFQFGGLGYMTLGSFIVLSTMKKLSTEREKIASATFTLPEDFDIRVFLRHVVIYAASVETVGAIGFYFAFRNAGVADPLWPAVFHSVSAFCTAGFSIFPNSLMAFRSDFWVNAIATCLSCCGAIGFLVVSDAWLTLTGKRTRMTLTSRVILRMTFSVILLGTVLLLITDPGIRQLPIAERLLAAGFQSMTALTTVGFNTHPIEDLAPAAIGVMLAFMILGASPSGTGGGLKTTSVTAAFAATTSILRRSAKVCYAGVEIPHHRVLQAFAAITFYFGTAIVGTIVLLLVQPGEFEDIAFEAASALGTVGLSRGLTGELNSVGKLVVICLMFIGRLGPLTAGLALIERRRERSEPSRDDLVV